jgi:hypothetical protein
VEYEWSFGLSFDMGFESTSRRRVSLKLPMKDGIYIDDYPSVTASLSEGSVFLSVAITLMCLGTETVFFTD